DLRCLASSKRGGARGGDREAATHPSRRTGEGSRPQGVRAGCAAEGGSFEAEEGAGEMSVAPDYAEPFEAWRVWRVVRRDGEYSLGSVIQRALWPAGEAFTADCLRASRLFSRFRRNQPHEAPEPRCECGIYAASLERVGQYLADA